MVFAEVVELTIMTIFTLLMVTQVIVPLWRGTKIFPLFRKQRKLEKDLVSAREETLEAQIEKRTTDERKRGERTRRRTSNS